MTGPKVIRRAIEALQTATSVYLADGVVASPVNRDADGHIIGTQMPPADTYRLVLNATVIELIAALEREDGRTRLDPSKRKPRKPRKSAKKARKVRR